MIHRLFKPKLDSQNENIWMTIYSDLITNLMLVFLALYGLTAMGSEAVAKAAQSMEKDQYESLNQQDALNEKLVSSLKAEFKNKSGVFVSEDASAIRIEFGEDVLFGSGRAALKPASHDVLRRLAVALKTSPLTVVVEGHTDAQPIRTASRYKNNWDLSLARSMAVVSYWRGEAGVPEASMAAAAYGEVRPRASNLTAEGRRMNRRVEIALYKAFPKVPGS